MVAVAIFEECLKFSTVVYEVPRGAVAWVGTTCPIDSCLVLVRRDCSCKRMC